MNYTIRCCLHQDISVFNTLIMSYSSLSFSVTFETHSSSIGVLLSLCPWDLSEETNCLWRSLAVIKQYSFQFVVFASNYHLSVLSNLFVMVYRFKYGIHGIFQKVFRSTHRPQKTARNVDWPWEVV